MLLSHFSLYIYYLLSIIIAIIIILFLKNLIYLFFASFQLLSAWDLLLCYPPIGRIVVVVRRRRRRRCSARHPATRKRETLDRSSMQPRRKLIYRRQFRQWLAHFEALDIYDSRSIPNWCDFFIRFYFPIPEYKETDKSYLSPSLSSPCLLISFLNTKTLLFSSLSLSLISYFFFLFEES